jgi:hypothetical protein
MAKKSKISAISGVAIVAGLQGYKVAIVSGLQWSQ